MHILKNSVVLSLVLLLEQPVQAQSVVLSNAVDAPQFIWTTGGNQPWVGQTNTTFDGIDAARSGAIGNSQESWIQTTITGAGDVVFRWKVSSESGFDFLEFYVNGFLQTGRISGETDWQEKTFSLPGGSQVLRWRYAKDSSAASGQDRGWLDTVFFIPATGPPSVIIDPQSVQTNFGGGAEFTVSLSGQLPMTYTWSKDGIALTNAGNVSGANTRVLQLYPVSNFDEGGYRMVASNALGSVTSLVAQLTVQDPFITGQPISLEANAGEAGGFSVFADGTQPLSFQWYRNGAELPLETNQFLSLPALSKSADGDYRVVISNSGGSVTSAVATLIVRDPFISLAPASMNRNVGENATFSVTAGGTPPLNYQWHLNGLPRPGATNLSLSLSNLLMADSGEYSLVVSNAQGSITSAPAVLTVNAVTLDNALSVGLGATFDEVHALAVQPDGRVLLGGDFDNLAGQSQTNIGRLNAGGTRDTTFNAAANFDVLCLALQADGKILVGGQFTTLGGQSRSRIGRLNSDGTLDIAFNPSAAGSVYSLVVQPDGKILVGGNFSSLGGQSRTNLGRLNSDGTLDTNFIAGAAGPFPGALSSVQCLALQPDGKILVGGDFTSLAGQSRTNLGRLNPSGSLDSAFEPGANGPVSSIALQKDGKILLAGSFFTLGGQPRQWIGRVNTTGTLDTAFNPTMDGGISSFALQADSKILVGGGFYTLNGQVRSGLGRLNEDGTLDLTFNPGHDGYDVCLALQPDGKILAGGNFATLGGQPRNKIGRLNNTEPATQSLSYTNSTVTWLRGGTSPEVWSTVFDYSSNGVAWTLLATGTGISGGWQVTGTTLPANTTLRARGNVSGDDKGSSWFVERYLGKPVFVTQPVSRTNNFGTSASLFAAAGGSEPISYSWRKAGVPLVNSGNISGANSQNLTVTAVAKADEGGYSLLASNSFGSVTSVVASLVVLDPFVSQQPVGADLNTGTNVTFQVIAGGTPPLNYQWYRNEAALIGATNALFALTNLAQANGGLYTVVVTGPSGSITSAPALLTVRPPLFVNPTPLAFDGFGEAVAALGNDRIIIGAPDDDTGAIDSGVVYVFGTNRNLIITITNPTPALEDHFGHAVAAVGSDRVLVGAWGDNTGTNDAGAAYLFAANGSLLTTFTNPTPRADESFGISVAAVGAEAVLIGAYFESDTSVYASGAAYLFDTNGTLLTTFVNPTPGIGDLFGTSVAAVGNDKVIIGAPWNNAGASDSGAAHLFTTNGTLLTTLLNPTPASSDEFGSAVTGVGSDRVMISARFDNTGTNDAGAAYLFSANGTLLMTFTNPTPSSPRIFGQAVASAGEEHVLISAHVPYTTPFDGKVYLFNTDGTLVTNITDPNPISGGNFGYALAVLGGEKAIIGAPDTTSGGEAYLIGLPLASATGPTTIVTHPQSQTVIQDSSVTLKVVAGGALPLYFQWFKNSNAISGATSSTYLIPNAQTNAAGVYSVAVSNSLAAVISSNAVLTVLPWIASTQFISFNETGYGRIELSNRLDHWIFPGLAGQQITFDLLNASAAGLRFELRGPSGWIGFTNLTGDSGLLNLPANGEYALTVRRTPASGDIAYAFKLIETTQTDLPLGTNFIGQFTGNAQAHIFKITLTNSGPVRITLGNSGAGNRAELYASRIVPPTRGTFEQQSASGAGANRELFIPNASVGTLYVLVYGDSIPTPGQFTIQANRVGVVLSGSTPVRQANNSSFAMNLIGAGFEVGDTVQLVAGNGNVVATATNVSLDSYSQLTADIQLAGAAAGLYSVRVSQLDGDTATLTNAFTVFTVQGGVGAAGSGAKLETRLILPGELGRDAPATLYVEYANIGSASMEAPLLIIKSSDPDGSDLPILTLDKSRQAKLFWSAGLPPGTAHEVFILASGRQPGVLHPGERLKVPVYFLGLLEPWDFDDTKIEMQIRYWTANDSTPIDWTARKESLRPPSLDSATWSVVYANLTAGLTNTGAYVRMLDDNARYLGRLGQVVTDVDDLWNFELQQAWGFSPVSVLDSVTDASLPAPGVSLEFSRRFSANVRSRNSTGWLGRGWYTPWQSQLIVENNGDLVRLVGEAGSASVFTRDTRTASRYFSGAGDSSSLTNLGGGIFELREPSGTVTRFRSDGHTDYVQDVNGNRVTAGYDGTGKITSLTHSSGGSITIAFNGAGLISSVSDSAGRTNMFTYSGPYLQTATTSDGKVTTYGYETAGNNAQRHALTSITRGGTTRSYTFDTRGRIASSSVAGGEQLVQFTYDSAGRVNTTDASGTTSMFYDHNGQLVKTQDPLGNITTSEFDSDLRLKRLITPTGESQSFTWCSCGSPASITDELGYTTKFSYENPFRRLTSFTDAKGNNTRYTYDTNGNLLATIYPNNSAEVFGGYTPAGLPLSYTNRRSQPITYTYTPAGQISRQSFTNGNYNDFFYDLRGNLTNVTEHLAGGTNKVTTYLYDYATAGDRLRKVTYPNARWVEFFYDTHGRRERMTDVTGQDLRYDFDAAGRLWRLRDATNAVIVEYLYNTAGRLQRINKGNGTYTTYDYDAAGQILHLVNHAPNGSVNSRFDYTYDRRGRRTSMGTVDGDWTYDYDATGQLIRAQLASTNPQIPNQDLRYNYDALGNRTTTVSNGVTTIYGANKLNQYTNVGGMAYQYDADGNLIFDGIRTHEYDVQNRLVRVTGPEGVTEYEYDASGNRTATVLNGQRTEYLLDPSGVVDVVAAHDGNNLLIVRNVHGLGLVARFGATSALSFFEFDALGSTAAISGAGGNVLRRVAYAPFGEPLSESGIDSEVGFIGQFGIVREPNKLYFMRARYYTPRFGRFLSEDPISINGSSINLQEYAFNDPITWSDISGEYSLREALREWAGLASRALSLQAEAGALVVAGRKISVKVAGRLIVNRAMVLAGSFDLGYRAGKFLLKVAPELGTVVGDYFADKFYGNNEASNPVTARSQANTRGPSPVPAGPGSQGIQATAEVSNSTDPNEKFGARGIGLQNWVSADSAIPYRINFENLSSATAPAQEVVIIDQLSTNLNWQTFELTELGFGDTVIPVPSGLQYYETTVQMTCCGDPFEAQIEAGLNTASGQLRIVFRSINPATFLPPPVSIGFLPPEDGTGRGKGHVSYLVNAKTNLPTGTQIRNVALISFDRQQTIATDQIDPQNPGAGIDPNKQALNTIDAVAPSSSVAALPAESGRAFILKWSGQDDVGGSGIADYDVFVSTNGGAFGEWLTQSTNTSAIFRGEIQKTYGFYTVARDQVGNLESAPLVPDTSTLVVSNAPSLADLTNFVAQPGSGFSVTNVILSGTAQGNFVFSLGNAPSGLGVNETNGVLNWTPNCTQGNTTNVVTVWVTDSARTNISDAISFVVAVEKCVEPSLGQVIVLAGESGQIPLNLISTAALTNLQASLVATPGRLLNFSIQPLVSNVAATSVQVLSNDWKRLSLSMTSNGFLAGTQQVAWLNFTAADLASAFVPLTLTNLIGFESNGAPVANFAPQSGRVVVLSDEPLVEMVRNTNGQPLLYIYGITRPGYSIEARTNLATGNWQTIISNLVMTNLVQPIIPPAGVYPSSFFRAQRVGSITPARLRSAELVQQTNVTFVVRGLAFRNYGVQMSSGLQSTNWQNIGTVTCDRDGIARFTNAIPASATERYFRTVVPQ